MTASSPTIAGVVLLIVFAGAVLGLYVGRRLPEHHLSGETRAVVSVSMAVVGTMSALVIGLLISSANTAFIGRNADVARLAETMVRLDSLLRRYGDDAGASREALRDYAARKSHDLFPGVSGEAPRVSNPATAAVLDEVQDRILALRPADARQRWLVAEALRATTDIGDARGELAALETTSVPLPFLGAVTLWLTVLFGSFGLFAPRNATALVALFCCAFAVAAAVKLVLDMDTPFAGSIRLVRPPIHLSSEPMADALATIRR